MRCAVASSVFCRICVTCAWLTLGFHAAAALPERPEDLRHPALLTNLFQLRRWAEEEPGVVHPFRVVGDVYDADASRGVLVLGDGFSVEFIQLHFQDVIIESGATVCLEGTGCALRPRGFGLAVVPRMVVNNDGAHGIRTESGTVFLRSGLNPIAMQWFNGIGDVGLTVEFEGPGLPRQRIPASMLSRAKIDATTGETSYLAGLEYRCFEGAWEYLPDFTRLPPARTGATANFDIEVRTRQEAVGLEFLGFIRIPQDGAYSFHVASDDGSRLDVGESSMGIRVLSNGPAPHAIERVPTSARERLGRTWAALDGVAAFVGVRGTGGEMQMRVGNDDIRVDVLDGSGLVPDFPPRTTVRVSGVYEDATAEDGSRGPGVLLVASWKGVRIAPGLVTRSEQPSRTGETTNQTVMSTTAALDNVAEVRALEPEQASRRLPVSIRGVVTATSPSSGSAVVQDSTRGIYIYLQDLKKREQLQRGEFCQIDGVTSPGQFAPLIIAQKVTRLGIGQLPQPMRATWEQLVNGSLETQYVEMDGVVTDVQELRVELLIQGGKIKLLLSDFEPEALVAYRNAHIRIRGCIFTPFNQQTRQLEPGPFRVRGAAIHVLQPAPRDLFAVSQKSIGELLLYDASAAPFRLLKVGGQIIFSRPGECYLTDGTNGMRVTTRDPDEFAVGELVEAVGFLDLGGPVAELREGMMRRTGLAPIPPPTTLVPERMLLASHAGKLVRVEATLINQLRSSSENVLELQSGFLAFRARISSPGQPVRFPPSGSRLELTGVYAPQGNRGSDRKVTGFELLLPSPAGIRVLATPSWWTLKRVLLLAGTLAALLCAVLVWNKQLHRQVQERGRQLESEIRVRERAEQQHAAEAERSRIARDLHDELGSGLTEVSLLASAGLGEFRGREKTDDRFRVIADKARDLVTSLDVIVWAVDPKRNSLQSFADYVGSYAKELLSASNIVCRLRIPIECDAVTLTGSARHSLLLAVKEALNNVIRHSSATEVEVQMTQLDDRLELLIADNGCGFEPNQVRQGDGLMNLRERLAALRGQCDIESQPGKGTSVRLVVPLRRDLN